MFIWFRDVLELLRSIGKRLEALENTVDDNGPGKGKFIRTGNRYDRA